MTSYLSLPNNCTFYTANSTLACEGNYGFFSNCSVTLSALIELANKGFVVEKIDFSRAFKDYRTELQFLHHEDLYPFFFKLENTIRIPTNLPSSQLVHHAFYHDLQYDLYHPFISRYFGLSSAVEEIQNNLIKKYAFDPENTISAVYRGTDKYTEVSLANPIKFLLATKKLMKKHDNCKVLIQTDQQQVRDFFCSELGNRCFYFEELPVTEGDTGIHLLDDNKLSIDKFSFAKMFLAAINLIAQSKYIVNHTGNVALWICLYRNSSDGMVQFDFNGKESTDFRRKLKKIKQLLKQKLQFNRFRHLRSKPNFAKVRDLK